MILNSFKIFENQGYAEYQDLSKSIKDWVSSVSFSPEGGKDPDYRFDKKTGRISANADFDIGQSDLDYVENVGLILPHGIKFGVINGDFLINGCALRYSDGFPEIVSGEFSLDNNNMKSLIGGPIKAGSYHCERNDLKDLSGSPVDVEEYFDCSFNPLESFKGAPKKIGTKFTFSRNETRSDEISIEDWSPAGRFEYCGNCGDEKAKLVLSSFSLDDIEWINQEIKKNPGRYILATSRIWNIDSFEWIRDLLKFPEGSQEHIKNGSDMKDIGF